MRRANAILASLAVLLPSGVAATTAPAVVVPEDYVFKFHLMKAVSSAKNKAGDGVAFEMVEPVIVLGETIVARGARGHITLVVSGHAGRGGHEGDLTFRFDGVEATQGRHLVFDRQLVEMNGRNNKVASAVLGFTPVVGLGAMFIRGHDITIEPRQVLTTVLLHPATAAPLANVFPAATPR